MTYIPTRRHTGKRAQPILPCTEGKPAPRWLEIIHRLIHEANYNYSMIAYRMQISSSTIQKLATNPSRVPTQRVLDGLLSLHERVFPEKKSLNVRVHSDEI